MADPVTTSVALTDDELLLLDGRCSDKVQAAVVMAHARRRLVAVHAGLTDQQRAAVAATVAEAHANGELRWWHVPLRHCAICGADAGYATHRRHGRYHRKGDTDHSKPLHMSGVEVARRGIRITGHVSVGGCATCMDALRPVLVAELASVRAALPPEIQSPDAPVYRRFDRAKCPKCGWTGHEGQMRQLPAIMSGTYPGGCPACPFDRLPFAARGFDRVDGFDLVEVPRG